MNSSLAPTPLRDRRRGCRIGPGPRNPQHAFSFGRYRLFGAYLAGLSRARLKGPIGNDEYGRLLRHLLESLGGTWTKLGQLLAMRRDVFSAEFCAELSNVHSRAAGFPGAVAKHIVEEDIGTATDAVFSEFGESPFAAASIGQVHEARLRESGVRVAVKVRRPFAVEQMEQDFRWLSRIVGLLERLRIKRSFAWRDLLWELKTALHEELDYRLEGAYLERMRKSLRPHGIHVPMVFSEYTTERVLVMEYVDGVFMSEFIAAEQEAPELVEQWLEENNISREKVGRTLNHSLNRQIFEDNFFHSDLHPGNIVLLRNSQIALIDFGAVGSLDASFLKDYAMYYQAIVNRQYDRALDLLLLITAQDAANPRIEKFRKIYLSLMRNFETRTATRSLSYHERSIVSVFGDIMREIARCEIPLDWSFMRADRAMLTLDASLVYLLPDVDYLEMTGEYWREALRRFSARSVRSIPRRLNPVAELITQTLATAKEWPLSAELLRAQSVAIRNAAGGFVEVRDFVLRLCSNALAWLLLAGTVTYLRVPGVAAIGARLHLTAGIASWQTLPASIAVPVLTMLCWLTWRMARTRARWLRA